MAQTTTTTPRYGVRVGDDGRWHAKYPSLGEARQHAARLSATGIGRAQIVDFAGDFRETWEDGAFYRNNYRG